MLAQLYRHAKAMIASAAMAGGARILAVARHRRGLVSKLQLCEAVYCDQVC